VLLQTLLQVDRGQDMSYRSTSPLVAMDGDQIGSIPGGDVGKDMSYFSPAPMPGPGTGGRDVGSDLYGSTRSRGSTRGRWGLDGLLSFGVEVC